MSGKENEIRSAVLEVLTKDIPENSIEKDKIEEETYEAIERTIILTARTIFVEIAEKQHEDGVIFADEFAYEITKVEEAWLKDACDFCGRRKSSVIKRKDGKRICAKCETEQGVKA